MDNEKLSKLSPKIKIHSDNERIDIFIDEFINDEEIKTIKIKDIQSANRGIGSRIINIGYKGGKPDSKELF